MHAEPSWAVMAAHRLGSIDEAWRVERQLKQDLNKCVNLNIDLLQRLDNQNLVIASLCKKMMRTNAKMVNLNIDLLQRLDNQNLVIASLHKKNDAYERKNGVVGGKDLNALLHLALHSCQIGNSILYFREYITVYECKASNAEDVTNKDESIG